MNKNISKKDKIIIIMRAGIKAFRGGVKKPFFKKSRGFLFVGNHVSITHAKHIQCGRNVKFESYSEIQGLASEGLIFGDNVTIGKYVQIRPSSYYGGDYGKGLYMGNNSSIGPNAYIGCSGKVSIGNNVMLGPKCSLFAENHNFADTNITIKQQGVNQKGIIIEDDCWIGSNVVILDGVTIGKGSVVGAGSLVSKDIPAGSVYINKRNVNIKQR
ncbi:acyltransferase [Lactobacillus reuteri]|nr:acyltransferase [Limosilactobacillus reuteri]